MEALTATSCYDDQRASIRRENIFRGAIGFRKRIVQTWQSVLHSPEQNAFHSDSVVYSRKKQKLKDQC